MNTQVDRIDLYLLGAVGITVVDMIIWNLRTNASVI